MKKNKFFSEAFLDECENELVHQFQIINGIDPFAYPIETPPEVREASKIFYNRLLFLLYQGARISYKTYVQEFYIIEPLPLEKTSVVLNSKYSDN